MSPEVKTFRPSNMRRRPMHRVKIKAMSIILIVEELDFHLVRQSGAQCYLNNP